MLVEQQKVVEVVQHLVEGTTVARINLEVINGEDVKSVGDALLALTGNRLLVVNFESVSTMTSGFLQQLITIRKTQEEGGGLLRLCCLQDDVREAFRRTLLDEEFDIKTTIDDALAI